MTSRRKLLTTLPAAFAAGLAGTSATRAAQAAVAAKARKPNVIQPGVRDAFPDIVMTDQFGRKHRFFDDLIHNNIVLLNFMTVRDELHLPVTAKLAQLAARLGDKLTHGDILMISVSRDPANDTPTLLREFAEEHGAPKQWLFLTGAQQDANDLSLRMYRMKHAHKAGARKTDIVFYGNGTSGIWGGFPVDIQISDMAERITWVMPGPKPEGKLRRAGPRLYDPQDRRNHNRQA